jgi:hypothetical protein
VDAKGVQLMNYVNFMRKIEGKEPHHDQQATNSTTSGARPLDLQGIIEFTRGLGYSSCDLEARPEVPDHRADIFWAGYNGWTCVSATMGLYSDNPPTFYWAGREYQQQHGDTHSQQQDTVPAETSRGDGGSDWVVNGDDVNLDEIRAIIRSIELFSMGSPSTSPLSRAEPSGCRSARYDSNGDVRRVEQPLRSTLGPEESGVQGVRDERESSERSREDARESFRRSLERGEGW